MKKWLTFIFGVLVFSGVGVSNIEAGAWTSTALEGAPTARGSFGGIVGVWTGTEVFIWGGEGPGIPAMNTGALYNPITNTWRPISSVNSPSPRRRHSAIWTGTEVIVWGGEGPVGSGWEILNNGASYNPGTGVWTQIVSPISSSRRYTHLVVWTGSEMIVYGGFIGLGGPISNAGARYNPSSNLWLSMTTEGSPPVGIDHRGLWTGTEFFVWVDSRSGFRYNPLTDTWKQMSILGAPINAAGTSMVWTGKKMILWGGNTREGIMLNSGFNYDPENDVWSPINDAPINLSGASYVWAGLEMIVWAGYDGVGYVNSGGRYNPEVDNWELIDQASAPSARTTNAVWTGNKMVVWGGYGGTYLNTGGVYDPSLDKPVTPTPTPTVTPTGTPTPMPPPTKKVVVVPGIEASWNQDALVNCKMDNYSGDWTMGEVAAAIYYPLLWNLGNAGWDVHIYNYDWRRQFVNHVSGLDNFIDGMVAGGEKVNVVGHSMGGLLGRAYLDEKKENSGVETLVTAGSPHSGTPLAYPAWSAGELWKDNLLDWFYVTLLQRRCQRINGWSDREAIQYAFPAIQNLLPISDYLIDNQTKNILPVGGMSAKNNWLPTEFSDPFYGVRVGTLSGKGKLTLDMIRVKEANKNDKKAGDWIDGKPVKKINSKLGDGAVLNSSSMLAGADNRSVNKNHLGLVSSEKGVAEILDLLGAPNAVPAFLDWSPPDSLLVAVTDSGNPSVVSPDGKVTQGSSGLAILVNTGKGKYKFKAGSETKWMGVGKFRKDGRMNWKDYDFLDKRPKLKEVEFSD